MGIAMKARLPGNEAERLEALRRYNILDTAPEEIFDDLALLVAETCSAPVALITLIDSDRQWFKSNKGLSLTETSRDLSFCAHAILQREPLIVRDTLTDSRFADNPLVTSEPGVRFYAAAPIITPEGFALGALCVYDYKPRDLKPEQIRSLQALSRQVVRLLELRRNIATLEHSLSARKQTEMEVERKNSYVEMLQSVTIAANESLTIEGAMRSCLERICSLAKLPIGHLYLLPKETAGEEQPITLWHLDDLVRFGTFQQVT